MKGLEPAHPSGPCTHLVVYYALAPSLRSLPYSLICRFIPEFVDYFPILLMFFRDPKRGR